jgi:hypothetical protein
LFSKNYKIGFMELMLQSDFMAHDVAIKKNTDGNIINNVGRTIG